MSDSLLNKEPGALTENQQRRRSAPWLLGGLVLLLLSLLVALQVFGLWEVFTPERAADTLLLYALSSLNFAAFIVFTFIFVRNLLKLRRERRERQLGSKIKTRMVVYFITVSLLPVTAMALFSYIFLNRSLEKWFSRLPEDVVSEAQAARQVEQIQREKSLHEIASAIALALAPETSVDEEQADRSAEKSLSQFIERTDLAALAIVSENGDIQEKNVAPQYATRQDEVNAVLERIRQTNTGNFSSVGKIDAAVVSLGGNSRLVALREQTDNSHLNRIIAGADTFETLRTKQRRIRLLGLSTLGLLTLMLLFVATWSAIHLARGIATPIRALAEAADEVARGNLTHRVTAIADDELAILAESFNQMTAQLEENRRSIEASAAELRDKNLALAERRDYIETVLESLSTGVISLDENDRVTTINAAAILMLRLPSAPAAGTTLAEIVSVDDHVVLDRVLRRARRTGRAAWQMELARSTSQDGGAVPVALTATALTPRSGEGRGVVLVMEDLSELLAAQRAAAWSEVARRMAHEIKNPLTPIQLSAERIARNFQRSVKGDGGGEASNGGGEAERERVARIIEECTATITREVAGLKAMVDEFSRFARLPHARLEPADLNEVVRQAMKLYEDRLNGVRLDVSLAHTLPPAMLDVEQIRRVFVNLIDNALEALAEISEGERRITVATAHDPSRGLLLAEVTDTGHGITRSDYPRLFQPYFSTRGRGTGLGLAIVHRIITEHGGRIRAEANHPRGAKFTMELPAIEETRMNDKGRSQESGVRSQKKEQTAFPF